MRYCLYTACSALIAASIGAQPPYDAAGNPTTSGPPRTFVGAQPAHGGPGATLSMVVGPATPGSGLAHDGDHLLMVSYVGSNVVYVLDENTGAVVRTVPIDDSPFGLAWDDQRDLFVTSDVPSGVKTYTASGTLVSTFAVGGAPVGCAWDCRRDVYWICDWTTNSFYSIDAATGTRVDTYSTAAGGCTRPAGVGYDAVRDVVYVGGRDQDAIFAFDAATGASLGCSYGALDGTNNPQGLAVAPQGSTWHSSFNSGNLYEQESCNPVHPRLDVGPHPGNAALMDLTVSGLSPNALAFFAASVRGCGPATTPFGELLLTPPVLVLSAVIVSGDTASVTHTLPAAPGHSVYLQAGDLGNLELSNGVVVNM